MLFPVNKMVFESMVLFHVSLSTDMHSIYGISEDIFTTNISNFWHIDILIPYYQPSITYVNLRYTIRDRNWISVFEADGQFVRDFIWLIIDNSKSNKQMLFQEYTFSFLFTC